MLSDRIAALEKTLAKYRGKPFIWGVSDCGKLARSHLVNMGHRPPRLRTYKSAIGAKTVIRELGFESLEALLDSMLPRIAPARMLPGDIALMEGDGVLDAITISVGRKVFGWHQDGDGAVIITPHGLKGAWRV